jgi:hypothetical protein
MEDHRRLWGWVDGEPVQITGIGPLPEGFTTEPPPPSPRELADSARRECLAQLEGIDRAGVRALRELAVSESPEALAGARERLAGLEAQAAAIRASMAALDEAGEGGRQ